MRPTVPPHLAVSAHARHNVASLPAFPAPFKLRASIMQIRNLGGSGLRVSAVGLGCNNFGQRTDLEASRKVIHKAIDLGVTLFDTADIYADMGGSETVLGAVLGDRRKDIVLATKYSNADGEGRHQAGRLAPLHHVGGRGQPDAAEDRLHRSLPAARLRSADADRRNAARARRSRPAGQGPLHRLFELSGLAHRGSRIRREAMNVSRFVSCQDEYSLVVRDIEKDLLPAAQPYNLGLLPYFPLASGLLTGKYKRGAAPPADTRFGRRRAARPLRHAAQRRHRRKAAGVRAGARPLDAGARLLLARLAPASLERDRRRDAGRADRAERESDRVEDERGRDRGDRRDHEVIRHSGMRHLAQARNR